MAIVLRFGNLPADHVTFAYSAAQEAMHSLHILTDPRHHPLHISWALQARKRLSAGLKAELEVFSFLVRGALPVFWAHEHRALRSFEEDVADLRQQPAHLFADHLLEIALGRPGEPLEPPGADRTEEAAAAATRCPEAAALFAVLPGNPQAVLDRFCNLLEGYWESVLSHDWPAIEELFVADIARRGRLILRHGVARALEGLSPDLAVDTAGDSCVLRRPTSREVVLTESDWLHLTPSYFAWPHLYCSPVQPHLLLAYPVVEQQREGRAPVPPERLLKLLRAAGDMTRLQILQLLGGRPRSTSELAGLIGITEASVSRHLKQLQEAGLVAAERQSYYVFYRAVKEPVGEMARGLEAVLSGEQDE